MLRHRFAVFVSFCTFLLVIAGSLVTSTGSGLAVPDWPLSFGKLMPKMEGGVLFEHGHRMIATAVGLLTIILAVWTSRAEDRRWVRNLGWVMLVAVVVQGLFGGLTVILKLPDAVSITHAGLAQIFFALTAIMATVTSPRWRREQAIDRSPDRLHGLARAAAAVIYLQIILGAAVRHTGAALLIPDFPLSLGRIVPPLGSWPIALNFSHRVGAALVAALAVALALRARRADGWLRRPALLLASLVALQIAFGAMTVLTGKLLLPTTAHVATGALIWVTSVVIATRSARAETGDDTEPAVQPIRRAIAA